jgi:hypothetical protein
VQPPPTRPTLRSVEWVSDQSWNEIRLSMLFDQPSATTGIGSSGPLLASPRPRRISSGAIAASASSS